MIMYAIKDSETGYYYNFDEDAFTEFSEKCLLPTDSMAIAYYDQYIGGDEKVMKVTIHGKKNDEYIFDEECVVCDN